MNERIEELFKRAGGKTSIHNLMSNPMQQREYRELWDGNIEKFAELIIKECEVALSPMLRDMISRGQGVELIKNHFGLLKAGEDMSDKGYSIGTKEGYDAFVEKRNAGNRSETLE